MQLLAKKAGFQKYLFQRPDDFRAEHKDKVLAAVFDFHKNAKKKTKRHK